MQKILRQYWPIIFIALLGVIVLSFHVFYLFYLLLFITFLLLKLDSRIFIVIALVFLIFCPFLLIFKQDQLADQSAIRAYYFLVMGIVLQLVELFREGRSKKDEAK